MTQNINTLVHSSLGVFPVPTGSSNCRTELHFVRCVKPNAAQVPSTFDASLVLHQLRCCGVLEVTRIARAGYPTRYLHQEFADRYGVLLTPKARGDEHTNNNSSRLFTY